MVPQHFGSTLRDLHGGAMSERQTLQVVRIVIVHIEKTGKERVGMDTCMRKILSPQRKCNPNWKYLAGRCTECDSCKLRGRAGTVCMEGVSGCFCK